MLLCAEGAQVNEQADDGYTALAHAAENGYYDVVHALLGAGLDNLYN